MDHGETGVAAHIEESRYRLLVESITDYAIYMLDPEGIVASWNSGRAAIQRLRGDEIIGAALFPLLYAGGPCRRVARASAQRGQNRRQVRDGRAGVCARTAAASGRMSSSTRSESPSGELIGYAKITRDLTERKARRDSAAAERRAVPAAGAGRHRLRDLHARHRGLCQQAGTPARSASRDTLPKKSSASISRRFYTEEDARRRAAARARDRRRTEGRFEKEGWRVRKDGTRFWASVVIDAIRDEAAS